jgi:hypothetical protein
MDASDIEMVPRDRFDSDEVYPGDELYKEETSYKPHMRNQNRMFFAGFSILLLVVGAALGTKIFLFPQAEVETEFEKDGGSGTVSNNEDNAKINEALTVNKKKKGKHGHAASNWAQNQTQTDPPDESITPQSGAGGKKNDFEDWHQMQVTKDDGVMYELVDTLVHDPDAFL